MTKKITIHSFADVDRSGKVRWTACELDYEIEEVQVKFGEHLGEDYQRINPYGQVPTATIEGENFIESTAICVLLAERHPEAALIPTGRNVREQFWQQASLMVTTLELPLVGYFLAQKGFANEHWADVAGDGLRRRLETFSASLPAAGYLAGHFSLADIFAGYVLRIAVQAEILPYEGVLAEYLDRLRARPAAIASRVFDSLET